MIVAERVAFSYQRSSVLHGVDLTTRPGRVLGLIGPNGSGKTTLLRTLYASLTPSSGAVLLDGADLRRVPARQAATQLAVVVQEHGGSCRCASSTWWCWAARRTCRPSSAPRTPTTGSSCRRCSGSA